MKMKLAREMEATAFLRMILSLILFVPTFCLLCLAPKVDSNLAWHPSNQSIVLLLLSLSRVCVWRIALFSFRLVFSGCCFGSDLNSGGGSSKKNSYYYILMLMDYHQRSNKQQTLILFHEHAATIPTSFAPAPLCISTNSRSPLR